LKKKLIYSLIPLLSTLLCFSNDAMAQGSSTPGGSVRLSVLSGGNVPFIFNSIERYQNGISRPFWTRFGITVVDSPPPIPTYTTWELTFRATTATIDGEGGNTLPLRILELTPSIASGLGGATLDVPLIKELSAVDQLLISDAIPPNRSYVTDQLEITYDCGRNLLGGPPATKELMELVPTAVADYYVVDIQFTLTATP